MNAVNILPDTVGKQEGELHVLLCVLERKCWCEVRGVGFHHRALECKHGACLRPARVSGRGKGEGGRGWAGESAFASERVTARETR